MLNVLVDILFVLFCLFFLFYAYHVHKAIDEVIIELRRISKLLAQDIEDE